MNIKIHQEIILFKIIISLNRIIINKSEKIQLKKHNKKLLTNKVFTNKMFKYINLIHKILSKNNRIPEIIKVPVKYPAFLYLKTLL
jgi:hypothetical protein